MSHSYSIYIKLLSLTLKYAVYHFLLLCIKNNGASSSTITESIQQTQRCILQHQLKAVALFALSL